MCKKIFMPEFTSGALTISFLQILTLEQSSFKPHLITILDVAAIELVGLAVQSEIKILSRFIRPQLEGNVLFKRKACALLRLKTIKQCAKTMMGFHIIEN